MSTPLSEVLNPKPVAATPAPTPEPVKAEPKVEAKPEPTPTPEKEPKGEKATPPVAKDAPKPEAEEPDEVRGLKRALAEAREQKRQLEAKLQATPEPIKPEFYENPEAYIGNEAQKLKSDIGLVRTELSQEFMREIHADYDAMEAEFLKLAAENVVLQSQLQRSPNPAKFAYETAKKAKALSEMGDPEAMKAAMRIEVEKEVRAKVEKELAEEAKKRADIKPSLAAVPGVTGATQKAPGSFHTPLSAILKETR